MKHLFIVLLALIVSVAAKAQTIDTAFHGAPAAKITPVKVKFNDSQNATYLVLEPVQDNMLTSLTINYALCANVTDYSGQLKKWLLRGSYTFAGTDYTAYQGDPETLMRYVATKLNLTFLR